MTSCAPLEGMTVSVDVSTGDRDADARVFATVTGAQYDNQTGRPMLLAEAAAPTGNGDDQPPGVDEYEPGDLPPASEAATRVREYVGWFGDGRVDTTVGPPLYARDLAALADAASELATLRDLGPRDRGFVVVEFNQASGRPEIAGYGEMHDSYGDADQSAEHQRRETTRVGRRERFAVARVVLEQEPS